MKTEIEGEVTASTILEQCVRMSNDNIWAFFSYSPHLDEKNRVSVRVSPADIDADCVYISSNIENYDKSLAEIMQDLISIEYQDKEKQS